MEPKELIEFLGRIEPLKSVPRHAVTRAGIPECVAAHSWRLATIAMLAAEEFPGVDMPRVIRMCLVHDIGEAVTGDIASFQKTAANERTEEHAIAGLLSTLPERERGALTALFAEMEALETPEAKLYKAFDKMEAILTHNEGSLASWLPLEYELQRTYAWKEAEAFPFTKAFREQLLEDTDRKVAEAKENNRE